MILGKRVVVLYATREGQARRIAEHAASTLRAAGLEVDVHDVGHLPPELALGGYAAAVLASSVHLHRHEREMVAFVKAHRAELERLPTAFLSVSLSEAGAERLASTPAQRAKGARGAGAMLEAFFRETGWRATHAWPVAGALLYPKYGPVTRLVMREIARLSGGDTDTSRSYEYTDWEALDRFMEQLVERIHAPPPGNKVFVGYATAHGSTEGIARAIGERLTRAGLSADVRSVDEVEALDAYDAVVLGSAIHDRRWLPQAAAFVRRHTAALARRPVWLFSVSSVGDTNGFLGPGPTRLVQRVRRDTEELAAFRRAIGPRGHRNFAGAIERTHWNLAGDLFLRAFGGTYGDHRDWRDIDAWADGIARQLRGPEAGRDRPAEARERSYS